MNMKSSTARLRTQMKLLIASDHAGFALKSFLKTSCSDIEWVDLGPHDDKPVDYPDFADELIKEKLKTDAFGVLICGSGQGMSMRANKTLSIRASLCLTVESARLARAHNDANILCLGGRLVSHKDALEILDTFIKTPFEGGRHSNRVKKISIPT